MDADRKGFTLLEIMIVIAIIGILATIAINLTLHLSEKALINTLNSDLSNAYKTSLDFHVEQPDDAVTLINLKEHGYTQSEKVTLNIEDGTADNLRMTASHPGVPGVYQVDQSGRISKQ